MKFAFINSSIYIIGFNFKPELILLQQKINVFETFSELSERNVLETDKK